jgi:hypothetical protein
MIETVQVQYVAHLDRRIVEYALDWYAQADDGSVWYFGEDVFEYENGEVSSMDGTWLVERDGPLAMIMPADPQIGNVYRVENIPGTVFEEVTVSRIDFTFEGPQGAVGGCMNGDQLHVDAFHSDKIFCPGYGEFSTATEDELEAVALAVPIDGLAEPVPAAIGSLAENAIAAFDAAAQADWTGVDAAISNLTAAWNGGAAAPIANSFLDGRMNEALAALMDAAAVQSAGEVRQAAVDVMLASYDLQLRHLPPVQIDLLRMGAWARQASVDAEDAGGMRSDAITMELILARTSHALAPADAAALANDITSLRGGDPAAADRILFTLSSL